MVGDKWGNRKLFYFPDASQISVMVGDHLFFFCCCLFAEESVNGDSGIGDGNATLMTVECKYPITLGEGGFSGVVCASS